jgi:hypothetical protein
MTTDYEMGELELRQRLLDFDRAVSLTHPGRSFRLVLVGGGALVLLGCLARATDDLDALRFPSELLPLMKKYDVNARVLAFEDQFAYHVDDRLVRLDIPTKAVECFTASLEDIVASKLHSDRSIDEADVRRPEVLRRLDWDQLDRVVADTTDSMLIPRRHEQFLRNYKKYREEFHR